MAELFSQVLDLKKKDVFLETKENDTITWNHLGTENGFENPEMISQRHPKIDTENAL